MFQNNFDIEKNISNACQQISSLIAGNLETITKDMEHKDIDYSITIGVNKNQLNDIIYFITSKLPYPIFLESNSQIFRVAQNIIAEKLILFLSRENINGADFQDNLSIFQDEILHIINNEIFVEA